MYIYPLINFIYTHLLVLCIKGCQFLRKHICDVTHHESFGSGWTAFNAVCTHIVYIFDDVFFIALMGLRYTVCDVELPYTVFFIPFYIYPVFFISYFFLLSWFSTVITTDFHTRPPISWVFVISWFFCILFFLRILFFLYPRFFHILVFDILIFLILSYNIVTVYHSYITIRKQIHLQVYTIYTYVLH